MKTLALITFPLALMACSNGVSDAEEQLRIVKAGHGSKRDVCMASRKLEGAYLANHDQANYEYQHAVADVDCITADIADQHS